MGASVGERAGRLNAKNAGLRRGQWNYSLGVDVQVYQYHITRSSAPPYSLHTVPLKVGSYNDAQGRLIEVLTGKSFGEVMAERLFEPLGMADTGFSVPAVKVIRHRPQSHYVPTSIWTCAKMHTNVRKGAY